MNSYILCATQPSNLGDLIINKMLIKELNKYGVVYVDCKNIPRKFADCLIDSERIIDTFAVHKVSVKTGNIFKWNSYLRSKHIDVYASSPGPAIDNSLSPLFLYLRLLSKILKINHIKEYLIGNCCSGALSENKKISFPNKKMVYLRSKASVRMLNDKGEKNVSYIPDLAFLLRQYVHPVQKSRTVIMSFRELPTNTKEFTENLKVLVSHFNSHGYKVEFYYQVEADRAYNEKLAELFNSPKVSFHKEIIWYDTLGYYADKMFVISNRLHSLLVGAVYGAVPIAIVSNDSKVSKIEEVFTSSLTNGRQFLVKHNVLDTVNQIMENYKSVCESLSNDVNGNCLEAISIIKGVSDHGLSI